MKNSRIVVVPFATYDPFYQQVRAGGSEYIRKGVIDASIGQKTHTGRGIVQ